MRMRELVCLTLSALISAASNGVAAQHLESSTVLGTLTGQRSPELPQGVQLYGTDLGWTFEHKDKLQIMFGDTWTNPDYLCSVLADGFPDQDDAQGYLPIVYGGGVPSITLETKRDAPTELAIVHIYRDGQLLRTSQNAGPMTAFSDGEHAIAMYFPFKYAACVPGDNQSGSGECPASMVCSHQLGTCSPVKIGVPQLCELGVENACGSEDQTCEPVATGLCIDATSSLVDITRRVGFEFEISEQRADDPTSYDSRQTFATNKFVNMTARSIRHLSEHGRANYRPGHGDLLLWGRPSFASDESNNTPLYLLTHELPFVNDPHSTTGAFLFHPRYFAGLDRLGRPKWSDAQADAKPLALDGRQNGDPHEVLTSLNQLTVTWLDAPVRRWVMFYGGGSPLNPDGPPTAAIGGVAAGAMAVRYAEHPWGPWSPPETLLAPGTPDVAGALYGPGGFLFHRDCADSPAGACAQSDPDRYSALFNGSCKAEDPNPDYGVLYAAGIIEPYTQRTDTGFDIHWTASTWNPYITIFVRSSISAGK